MESHVLVQPSIDVDFGLDIVHEVQQSLDHVLLLQVYVRGKLAKLHLSLLLSLLGKIIFRPGVLQEKTEKNREVDNPILDQACVSVLLGMRYLFLLLLEMSFSFLSVLLNLPLGFFLSLLEALRLSCGTGICRAERDLTLELERSTIDTVKGKCTSTPANKHRVY